MKKWLLLFLILPGYLYVTGQNTSKLSITVSGFPNRAAVNMAYKRVRQSLVQEMAGKKDESRLLDDNGKGILTYDYKGFGGTEDLIVYKVEKNETSVTIKDVEHSTLADYLEMINNHVPVQRSKYREGYLSPKVLGSTEPKKKSKALLADLKVQLERFRDGRL